MQVGVTSAVEAKGQYHIYFIYSVCSKCMSCCADVYQYMICVLHITVANALLSGHC